VTPRISRLFGYLATATATGVAVASLLLGPAIAQGAPGAWQVVGVTGPTNLPPSTPEIQEVSVDAAGGTFTLALGSESTGPLRFDASAAELEAALAGLPGLSGGGVTVTGGPGNPGAELPYLVTFGGRLAGDDVEQLTGAATAGTVAVATQTEGSPVGTGEIAAFATNVAASSAVLAVKITIGPLPGGIETAGQAGGAGWSCPAGAHAKTVECMRTEAVRGGGAAPPVTVPLLISGAAEHSAVGIVVEGGGVLAPGVYSEPITVSPGPAPQGVAAFWAGAFNQRGEVETQAGGHPYAAMTFFLRNTDRAADGRIVPAGDLREARVKLPPGFVGDPLVTRRCPQSRRGPLPPAVGVLSCGEVPDPATEATIGTLEPFTGTFARDPGPFVTPGLQIFNDVPPEGYAAEFTGKIVETYSSFLGAVRSSEDFGITISAPNIPSVFKVFGAFVVLEGTPSAAAGKAFLTNPTDCGLQAAPPFASIETTSYEDGLLSQPSVSLQPAVTGCDRLEFHPSFRLEPGSSRAATGTATTIRLHVDQQGLTDPNKLATPHLKKTVAVLPAGLDLNPAAADGLQACSEAQMGFLGGRFPMPTPLRFDESPPRCPDASKLGTVQIATPLLEKQLEGTVYLAEQDRNPFGSLLALYLVVDDPETGVVLKLPGEVVPDAETGQLTATFDDNPQLPFEDLVLHLRGGGPRSELATPEVCGHYAVGGSLEPWSAPESGPPAQISEAGFQISGGPGGSACADSAAARPFAPGFEAGSDSTEAGAFAPLTIRVARKDGEQEIRDLQFRLPKGLTGKLAGIPYCPDAAIAAAQGKSGRAEQASPSCPSASRIGTVDTAAGVGSEPIHVGGKVYLAGPYEGAPLSSVVITPALAGPFDLGDVVVRAPLYVDPETAEITARSDALPTILKGIPLKLRSVVIDLDRPDFTLNPTSCEPMEVSATVTGSSGATAQPADRFQVGDCARLGFGPRLKVTLKGATGRTGHPALKAVLTYPKKGAYANIRRAQVNLPHSEFLDQGNLNKTCTRPVLLEGRCPKKTIYGHAKAWTPLLDQPLQGPVYLVGGFGYKLPALVAELNGQIRVVLKGKVDSGPNKGIRNTFEAVPDAPVSRFVLEMKGGRRYGLLENSENLCRRPRRLLARFTAQNGRVRRWKPKIADSCAKKGKKRRHNAQQGTRGGR
jgi:hypothetical protein